MPLRLTRPTRPGANTWVGMIPTEATPGLMTPGQFGPTQGLAAALAAWV